MKSKRREKKGNRYIPIRYIVAILITVMEVALIIGVVLALSIYVPYFYFFVYLMHVVCVISIIASDDNPDYKVPWLLVVLTLPIVGFMLYFIFYRRKLKPKFIKRLQKLSKYSYEYDDTENFSQLKQQSPLIYSQAKLLCNLSGGKLFKDTNLKYFSTGEEVFASLLDDLKKAKIFIYLEYFIIAKGQFWNRVHEILLDKVKKGVEVKVVYDDIGCMMTLPSNYFNKLKKEGINCVPFSLLKGQADCEFNNRSHRKITIIDGEVAYTGGLNLADEYINVKKRFGYWKDCCLRLEGYGVYEYTKLFIIDFGINERKLSSIRSKQELYPKNTIKRDEFVVPFGDGPKPLYQHRVSGSLIENMIETSTESMWITTPYLIIDNTMCLALENASLRGVDVRIVVPKIPDKKLVYEMTKAVCERLMKAGVKIYEYAPGFIHQKSYLSDGRCAMIGTVNFDYRSLVHHFENGVWTYNSSCVESIKADIEKIFLESIEIKPSSVKPKIFKRLIRVVFRVFAPLL